MNEMRFSGYQNNQPKKVENNEPIPVKNNLNKNKIFGTIFRVIVLILIVVGLAYGGFYLWQKKGSVVDFDPTASNYYAIFMANGQVYFGIPVSKSKSEFVLSDVYYLQVADNVSVSASTTAEDRLSSPKFSLVKLGQELHGPTDKLYVNMTNLLFYEQLKANSQVVANIKNYKK